MDRKSWYSATPESIASHQAKRSQTHLIADGFCGPGGNVIQIAQFSELVFAFEHNISRLGMARHNAVLYSVNTQIEFFFGKFRRQFRLSFDVVFFSPPWGGPFYKSQKTFDIEQQIVLCEYGTLSDYNVWLTNFIFIKLKG